MTATVTAQKLQKLPHDFYQRDTQIVAKELLGKYLVRVVDGQEMIAKIVEVEAYLGVRDLGAHSSRGRTKRTEIMFGPPGYAYIYLIYGMYYCLNFVTEPPEHACAVLIRAVEPIQNIPAKTTGPGLLCKAMQIDMSLNKCDLGAENFYVAASADAKKPVIVKRPRIGIDYAKHWTRRLLRFYIKGNAFISKP